MKKDDKVVYANMPKLKRLPKTKKQAKYWGPCTVSKVTESHVTISKTELGDKKDKKILFISHSLIFKNVSKSPEKLRRKSSLIPP